ncbi:chitin-binding type-2 domain-containing protein [Caerostris darwini]|uniref:Chitin-binding type-2 domain-containing protein n=1 Tax=Caerostris darwini TaxID=1538125 RepID=A0AAV4QTT1_9ARAC|nr:chitin-binding type-2 domain-containing protein [Caerostris darwini]
MKRILSSISHPTSRDFQDYSFATGYSFPEETFRTITMKTFILCALVCLVVVAAKSRSKRAAFDLPDGADLLVGSVRTTFTCPQGAEGYYADTENSCQIFHVCHTVQQEDGTSETQQFSFLCGNQTVFNQLSFTCSMPEDAVPCNEAPNFFYLNDNLRLGDPKVAFLDEQDIQRAAPLIQSYGGRLAAGGAPAPPRRQG